MNKKILVIDDDLYIRELYQEILASAGFVVSTAIDGEEGLQKLTREEFDLILLDLMMPKIDGLGVLKALKQDLQKEINSPILLLSNMGKEPVIDEALKNGVADYLVKSDINPDQLLNFINKYLK